MSFKQKTNRQSQYPDFRVGFMGFEAGSARIAVSIKEPQYYVQGIFVQSVSTISLWNDFYANLNRLGQGIRLGQLGLAKDLSQYWPVHTDDPNFDVSTAVPPIGGEFIIPIGESLFFWVQVPVMAVFGGVDVGFNTDPIEQGKRIKIGFGPGIPQNQAPDESGEYVFYLPIFKIRVNRTSIDLGNYDLGECVFLSPEFDLGGDAFFEFSEASSYYD